MFPEGEQSIIAYARRGSSVEEIVNLMLLEGSSSDESKATKAMSADEILKQNLQEHAENFFDHYNSYFIHTSRSCIFNTAQAFYKNARRRESLLRKDLRIDFGAEEGVDAGALRNEYFEQLLIEIDNRYLNEVTQNVCS